jgi:ABC-type amino acid transport substrate-binding protein
LAGPYAAIVIDRDHSEEAVEMVRNAVYRENAAADKFLTTETFRIVQLNKTDGHEACRFVRKSAAVHLTSTCLPQYASRLRRPVVSFPTRLADDDSPLTYVSFMEGGGSEIPVLVDIAKRMNWTSAVYVGDTNEDTVFLQRLMLSSRSFALRQVISVHREVDLIQLYARIETSVVDFVIIHCESYQCYGSIKKLFSLRIEKTDEASPVPWLMTAALTQNAQYSNSFEPLAVFSSTTYGLQKTLPSSRLSDILLDDVSSLEKTHSQCYALEQCPAKLQQHLEVLAFFDSLTVLLSIRQRTFKDSSSMVHFINEANVKGISGVIRFDNMAFERSPFSIYNVLDISPSLITKIGAYDSHETAWLDELRPLHQQHGNKRDRSRRGAQTCRPASGTFRVTTMREPPFVIYDPNNTWKDEAHNGPYTGFVIDMMERLAQELNFTYTMSEPADMKYGSIINGVGNGMVGEIMNCTADLAGAAMAITSERSQVIQFTKPYIEAGKTFLAYKPVVEPPGLWSFLNPFDVKTRIVVIACLLVVSVVFAVLGKFNAYREVVKPKRHRRRRNVKWPGNSFWFIYTTFMQQGPDAIPSNAGKTLVAGWFFFCLVIVATYTANLAAFLTVKNFEDTVQSLDDLAHQTDIVYGTVADTSIVEFFKTSTIELHQNMYWYMTHTPNALVDTAEDAYDRIRSEKGKYIFIWDEPILDYVASREPCNTQVVGRAFVPDGYGIAMPKGMPYESEFSLAILKMRETAVIENLRRKWLQSGPCSSASTSSQAVTDAEEIRLNDLAGIFTILGLAVGLSLIVGMLELLYMVWRRKKLRTLRRASNGQIQVMAQVKQKYCRQ